MAAAGQIALTPALTERARALYRPDLYDAAWGEGAVSP
jgi:NitT/TauT family transport system ATP-binding protein